MRIAIVDDLAGDRALLRERLERQLQRRSVQADLLEFESGEAFLAAEREQRFTAAFLDVYMTGMSGVDAAKELRTFDTDCLLIFTTTSTDHALEGFQVRAMHYLVKPFDSAQITACLRKLNLLPESRPAVRGDKPGNAFCTQFSVWLEHHYMRDVSLDQAAEAMGMSAFYFSRFFRTSYNQTFLEYLTAYRIDRAVELLQQTDIPVREIAVRVGYTDANYFTKVFKRHLGVTPTEYRNHNAN